MLAWVLGYYAVCKEMIRASLSFVDLYPYQPCIYASALVCLVVEKECEAEAHEGHACLGGLLINDNLHFTQECNSLSHATTSEPTDLELQVNFILEYQWLLRIEVTFKKASTLAGDDTPMLQAKTLVSKVSTMQIPKVSPTSSSLTAMASKSLSYKGVSVSPPVETESEKYGEHVLKLGCSGHHDNSVETTRSKLSAGAEPPNPGVFPLTHRVVVTSVCDVITGQGILAGPVGFTPFAARVPCGP
ncbi:hypothetical protein POM88_045445 [Heracleum sosnowskyi]|uniref:Uncharacterized protein n=1 Tax=Heracleum sosnowskyi TaxID=360622 RepID=A0AAD8H6Z8_9APIA|nr:hypothetical protein POM88_045445 [Heracleum sosnowskyi]